MESLYEVKEIKQLSPVSNVLYDLSDQNLQFEYEYEGEENYSIPETKDVKLAFCADERRVLEDLPPKKSSLEDESPVQNQRVDEFFAKTQGILKMLQAEVMEEFNAEIKMKDLQNVIGKLILTAQVRKRGSDLISRFLEASRANNHQVISHVFDSFSSQAEILSRVIISERFEAGNLHLIAQAFIGGVAGGKKFLEQ
jgi:hypothetical protein